MTRGALFELSPGQVVRCAAGHDAGGYFVVTAVENGRVLLADGRRRKLALPKRKNPRHIRKTGHKLRLSDIKSDTHLKRLLSALQSNEGGNAFV